MFKESPAVDKYYPILEWQSILAHHQEYSEHQVSSISIPVFIVNIHMWQDLLAACIV